MIVQNNKPVTVGEVSEFVLHKIERVEYGSEPSNIIRLTFKRTSDDKMFTHDFRMNAWVDPSKLYADFDLVPGQDNTAEEDKAFKKLVDKINEFNEFESKVLSGEVEVTNEVIKQYNTLQKSMPFSMIGRQQLVDHLFNIAKVVDVDMNGLVLDGRMNKPAVTRKTDMAGNPKTVNKDRLKGTKFYGASEVNLDFDYGIYKELIKFVTKNIVGKPFNMVVGGEFAYKDGSGPHPSLPAARTLYLEPAKEGEPTIKFDDKVHVDYRNQKTGTTAQQFVADAASDEEDLPF